MHQGASSRRFPRASAGRLGSGGWQRPWASMTQMMQYEGLEGSQKNKVHVAVRFRPLRYGGSVGVAVGGVRASCLLAAETAAAVLGERMCCCSQCHAAAELVPPAVSQATLLLPAVCATAREAGRVPPSSAHTPVPHHPPAGCCSDKERARGDREVWECSGNAVGILEDVGMKVRAKCEHPEECWSGAAAAVGWAGMQCVAAVVTCCVRCVRLRCRATVATCCVLLQAPAAQAGGRNAECTGC